MSTYSTSFRQTVTKTLDNTQDTQEYLLHKTLKKRTEQDHLIHNQDVRESTIVSPSQGQNSSSQSPSTASGSNLDILLQAFKDCHNILDEVLLVMILSTQNSQNRASDLAEELKSLVQASQNLKKAADAMDAYNKYIQTLKSQGIQPPYIIYPTDLDDPTKGLQPLKEALIDLGGWSESSGESVERGIQDMATRLEQNDMILIDSKSNPAIFDADVQVILNGQQDPTSSAQDMYSLMTTSSQNATQLNTTKSTQLQNLMNNVQMFLSMATSLLQRAQDLNSKITSLT